MYSPVIRSFAGKKQKTGIPAGGSAVAAGRNEWSCSAKLAEVRCRAGGGEMATSRLLADLLDEYSFGKKTGAIYIEVAEASENLIRFYFNEGCICSVSFGPIKGKECLDILDCYNLGKAVYFAGLKTPSLPTDLPLTEDIVTLFRKSGKQVKTG
jgi:hypothetical protein